jgi:hypothetical protein
MNSTTTFKFNDLYDERATNTMGPGDMFAVALLSAWTLGFLWLITHTRDGGQIPPPPFYRHEAPAPTPTPVSTDNWTPIGIYHLNKPQTLTKKERDAIDTVGGGNATYLYEKKHASGKKSWRYSIGDTWFYPTETAVRRRGLDMFGSHLVDLD